MPDLIGKLGYDGRGWSAGLNQAIGEANKASAEIADHFSNAFSGNLISDALQKGFAAAGIGAVGALIEKLADGMKEKFHEIHIGSEMLQVDPQTFQKIANVTKAMGAGPETVATAMEHVAIAQTKIAEGAPEADKLIGRFAELGISLEQLQSQNFQEIFFKIAEGMRGAEASGDKLVAIHEVLGRAGKTLIPSFQAGFDGSLANRGLISDEDLHRLQQMNIESAKMDGFWKSIGNEVGMWAATLWSQGKGLIPGLGAIYGQMTGIGPVEENKMSRDQEDQMAGFREKDADRLKEQNEQRLSDQRDAAARSANDKKNEQIRKERDRLDEQYDKAREESILAGLSPEERKDRISDQLDEEYKTFTARNAASAADANNMPLQIEAMKSGLRIFGLQKELYHLDKDKPLRFKESFDSLARIGGFNERSGSNQADVAQRILRAAESAAAGITTLANDPGL
jgi:hypothetical protein